jgi:hypothetical protein
VEERENDREDALRAAVQEHADEGDLCMGFAVVAVWLGDDGKKKIGVLAPDAEPWTAAGWLWWALHKMMPGLPEAGGPPY